MFSNAKVEYKNNNRVLWLDAIKGIGVVFVIIGHSHLDKGLGYLLTCFVYSFHLPLFMCVAGFLFKNHNEMESFGSFVEKRFKSLIIPYLFYGSLCVIFDYCLRFIKHDWSNPYKEILGFIFQMRGNLAGPCWFLTWMFISQCVFYFIQQVNSFVVQFFVSLFLFGLGTTFYCCGLSFPFYLESSFIACVFIFAGRLLKRYQGVLTLKYNGRLCTFLMILGGGSLILNEFLFLNKMHIEIFDGTIGNPLLFLFSAFCFCYIVIYLIYKFDNHRVVLFLGKIGYYSITIYCLNNILGRVCYQLCVRLGLISGVPIYEFTRAFINLFFCTGTAYFIGNIFRKYIPMLSGYKVEKGENK